MRDSEPLELMTIYESEILERGGASISPSPLPTSSETGYCPGSYKMSILEQYHISKSQTRIPMKTRSQQFHHPSGNIQGSLS